VLNRYAVTTSGKAGAYTIRPVVEPPLRSLLSVIFSARRPITPTQQAMLELITAMAKKLLSPARRGKLSS
jgi:LysR family nitrogen assimilation transcriptional regulator